MAEDTVRDESVGRCLEWTWCDRCGPGVIGVGDERDGSSGHSFLSSEQPRDVLHPSPPSPSVSRPTLRDSPCPARETESSGRFTI